MKIVVVSKKEILVPESLAEYLLLSEKEKMELWKYQKKLESKP